MKSFNRSMFTGRMTEAEMRREHPFELDVALLKRRERVFFPLAALGAALLLAAIYWFVSFEQTAITTLPAN